MFHEVATHTKQLYNKIKILTLNRHTKILTKFVFSCCYLLLLFDYFILLYVTIIIVMIIIRLIICYLKQYPLVCTRCNEYLNFIEL